MSQGSHPYSQIEHERKTRWARRDASLHPLTDAEKAERRHHHIAAWWMRVLWLGPIAASLAVSLLLREPLTPVLVAGAMLAACTIAVLVHALLSAVLPYEAPDHRFWITVGAITLPSAVLIALLIDALINANIDGVTGTIGCVALLPFWPFAWRWLRRRHVSDHERNLTAASAPQGIIE